MSHDIRTTIQNLTDDMNGGSYELFISSLADDASWTIVGEHTLSGREAIREFMAQADGHAPPQISIDTMIVEGDKAAVFGDMSMADNGEKTEFSYCDIYHFDGPAVRELRSLIIKKQKGEYKCHP